MQSSERKNTPHIHNRHRPVCDHIKYIGICICKLISQLSQFSCSVVSDSLRPHELQHTRPPCPSSAPRVYPNSCPSSWWCHPAISSSVNSFSSFLQSLPASGSFPMSQFFAWGGQSIGVSASASVLPISIGKYCPCVVRYRIWVCSHIGTYLQLGRNLYKIEHLGVNSYRD